MDNIIQDILKSAKAKGLGKDDLIIEAETLESCGEYMHLCFVGYSPEQLREAAETM